MRVILARHARAVERDVRAYPDDRLRPLVSRRRNEQAAMAAALACMELGVSHLLSSPLARARETAEITAEHLGFPAERIQLCEELAERSSTSAFLTVLRRLPSSATGLAVGHETHLAAFAAEMLHPAAAVLVDFRRSAILSLAFEGHPEAGRGELKFFLTPRVILPLLERMQ